MYKQSTFAKALDALIRWGQENGRWGTTNNFEDITGIRVRAILDGEHQCMRRKKLTAIFARLHDEDEPLASTNRITSEERDEWRRVLDEALAISSVDEAIHKLNKRDDVLTPKLEAVIRAYFETIHGDDLEKWPAAVLGFTALKKGAETIHSITAKRPDHPSGVMSPAVNQKTDNIQTEAPAARSTRSLTLVGSTQNVMTIAFSPDGQQLASGCVDRKIRLWRLRDGAASYVVDEEHAGEYLAFSPDGQILAGGGYGNTVRLWRVRDGSVLRTLRAYAHAPPTGFTHSTYEISFAPDGQSLASISTDSNVQLWRVSDGRLIRTLEGHEDFAYTVAFSPDGAIIASGSLDKTIRLWRASDGKLLRILRGHALAVKVVRFLPDGQTLLSAATDDTVRWWRVSDGRLLRTLPINESAELAFTRSGKILASSLKESPDVHMWDLDAGKIMHTIRGEGPPPGRGFSPSRIAFSPNEQQIAVSNLVGYQDAAIRIYNII